MYINKLIPSRSLVAGICLSVPALVVCAIKNFLLFHTLVEVATVAVGFALFLLAWNARGYLNNNFLLVIGIGYGFCAVLDLLHTLAFKGMNIFPADSGNLTAQLWTAARWLQATTLLAAASALLRTASAPAIFRTFATVAALLTAAIFSGMFPDCFRAGTGLTGFKIASECLIIMCHGVSLGLLYRNRRRFGKQVFVLVTGSIVLVIVSGLTFTVYGSALFGPAVTAGHILKFASFCFIYQAVLDTGIKEPFELIFREQKQAQEVLLASEQLFRALVENSPDFIARYDLELRRIYVNPALQRLFGVPAEHLLDSISASLASPLHDPELYKARLRQVIETAAECEAETYFRTAGGETRCCNMRFVPEFGPGGRVATVLAIGHDIHELKQSEQRFRTLAENSPDSILRYNTGCRCIYANPRIEKTLGVPAGSMPGKTPMELFPAGEYREYQSKIEEVLRTGAGAELEVVVPDSGEGIQQHHVRFTAEHGEHGDVIGVLVIGRDITGHKRAEETLRESEERYRSLVELSPDVVVIRNQEHIVYANPAAARMAGVKSADDLIGRSILDFCPPERLEEMRELVTGITEPGATTPFFETGLLRPDGSRADIELAGVSFQYRGTIYSQVVARDITERKQATEALLAKQQKLTDMAVELSMAEERERRNIAVELHDHIGQNLLLGKIRLSQVMKDLPADVGRNMLDEVLTLQDQIIQNVRSLTQQLSPPILARFGLEAALEWLGERIEEDYGLRVRFEDDRQQKPLSEDMSAIVFQACRELLINVAKHANVDEARVTIGRDHDMLYLMVEDHGAGFDVAAADAGVSRNSGFGLFNIRERIKHMRGEMTLESAPGRGTRVTLRVAFAETSAETPDQLLQELL